MTSDELGQYIPKMTNNALYGAMVYLMDPEVAFEDYVRAISTSSWDEARDCLDALIEWLTRGGFVGNLQAISNIPKHTPLGITAMVAKYNKIVNVRLNDSSV